MSSVEVNDMTVNTSKVTQLELLCEIWDTIEALNLTFTGRGSSNRLSKIITIIYCVFRHLILF